MDGTGEKAVRAFVRRLALACLEEPRVRALWIEGPDPRALRDYPALAAEGALDLHAAAADPDFDAVAAEAPELLGRAAKVLEARAGAAPFEGARLDCRLEGGLAVAFTLERLSLVGKRPRDAIEPVVDRSGQLRFVVNVRRA